MKKVFVLLLASLIVMLLCNEIVLADSVPCSSFPSQTCYSTKEEAVSHVPAYITPKDCFVWNDNSDQDHPWRVIFGNGCAHWVSHELGLGIDSPWRRWERGEIEPPLPAEAWNVCYDGFYIKVEDVCPEDQRQDWKCCQKGDIWVRADGGHCGIVRDVTKDPETGEVISLKIEHCSSACGEQGVCFREPIFSGTCCVLRAVSILKPSDGFVVTKSIGTEVTFIIRNMGNEKVIFAKGDVSNRIDLESRYRGGEFGLGWGVQIWSTTFEGLTLDPGETYTKTITWCPKGEGDITLSLVHWVKVEPDYFEYGPFGKFEVNGFVTQLPIASFTYSPEKTVVDEEVTFDASASYDPDGGDITNYRWVFYGPPLKWEEIPPTRSSAERSPGPLSSESVYASSSPIPIRPIGNTIVEGPDKKIIKCSFCSPGLYQVSLTVTDDEGDKNWTSKGILIHPEVKVLRWEVTNLWEDSTLHQFLNEIASLSGYQIDCIVDVYVTNDELVRAVGIKLSTGQEGNLFKEEPGHYIAHLQSYEFSPERYSNYLSLLLEIAFISRGYSIVRIPVPEHPPEIAITEITIVDSEQNIHHITRSGTGQTLPERLPSYESAMSTMIRGPWGAQGGTLFSTHCPVDLLVEDSQGRRVGALYESGVFIREINEIPGAFYGGQGPDFQFIFIPSSFENYTVEVISRDIGDYILNALTFKGEENSSFTAIEIPTAPGAVHQYTIDWDALSQGEKGVTVQIDNDGDGVFEQTFTTGDTFQLALPGISVNKVADPPDVAPASNVEFTITVPNTGDCTLDPVKVVDTLPPWMSYVSSSPAADTHDGTIIWNSVGPLDPGASKTITLVARIASDASGTLTNAVTVTGTNLTTGVNVTDSDTVTVTVLARTIEPPTKTLIDVTTEIKSDGIVIEDEQFGWETGNGNLLNNPPLSPGEAVGGIKYDDKMIGSNGTTEFTKNFGVNTNVTPNLAVTKSIGYKSGDLGSLSYDEQVGMRYSGASPPLSSTTKCEDVNAYSKMVVTDVEAATETEVGITETEERDLHYGINAEGKGSVSAGVDASVEDGRTDMTYEDKSNAYGNFSFEKKVGYKSKPP